jgi:predicted nucleic acid-binding protein
LSLIYYLDTNVLISFYKEDDPYHKESVEILEAIKQKKISGQTSVLTILEMVAVTSRNIRIRKGEDETHLRSIAISKVLVTLSKLGVTFISSQGDTITVMEDVNVEMPIMFSQALILAYSVGLRTLDLMHVAAARNVRQAGTELSAFVTGDSDFVNRKDRISQILGTPVLTPLECLRGIGLS